VLQAMQTRGWKDDYWNLVSQSPEVGTTNLQEKKIDAHADFVPFADLLPYRGFARKIFDGAETKVPTFHGVVVRKDFATEYPEVVVAYIKAMIEADTWVRSNPTAAAAKIEEWTKIEKEVAYLYLGPGGIHTLDPTIKPRWLDTIKTGHEVLTRLNRVKPLDINAWVNETYVRQAYLLPLMLCIPMAVVLLLIKRWFVAHSYRQLAVQLLAGAIVYGLGLGWAYITGHALHVGNLGSLPSKLEPVPVAPALEGYQEDL